MECLLCGTEDVYTTMLNFNTRRIGCPICGQYAISDMIAQNTFPQLTEDKRYLFSAITRQANETGKMKYITKENFSELLDSIPNLTSPLENIDRTLLLVKNRQNNKGAYEYVSIVPKYDYPLVFARDHSELHYFLSMLKQQGLLEDTVPDNGVLRYRLTPEGWQRAIELQKTQRDSNQAFVAMWFNPDLISVWQDGFKPALEATGFSPYRVDMDEFTGKIDDKIIAEIRRSGLLVADFTGHRGSVYFEAGFGMGLGIPVIYTCRKSYIKKCQFDTRQYPHIIWNSPDELKTSLINKIRANIPGR
jgi:hypothetical protein